MSMKQILHNLPREGSIQRLNAMNVYPESAKTKNANVKMLYGKLKLRRSTGNNARRRKLILQRPVSPKSVLRRGSENCLHVERRLLQKNPPSR